MTVNPQAMAGGDCSDSARHWDISADTTNWTGTGAVQCTYKGVYKSIDPKKTNGTCIDNNTTVTFVYDPSNDGYTYKDTCKTGSSKGYLRIKASTNSASITCDD